MSNLWRFVVGGIFVLVVAALLSFYSGNIKAFHGISLEFLGPIQNVSSRIVSSLGDFKEDYVSLLNVREENKQLRLLLDEYKKYLNEYREAYHENRFLREELDFKKENKFPSIVARVVGKDPSLWFKTIMIDRGKNDGIDEGMVVRTSSGVVGQTIQVSDNYCKVLLANAPSSAIDAMIQKTRVRGILRGSGDQGYTLKYVIKSAEVSVGDVIITAGIGGVFSTGIPLGKVSVVRKKLRGMFQEILVEPAVDFQKLEFVFIDLTDISSPYKSLSF